MFLLVSWRLHTNLYKFGVKTSPHILQKKNCCDLNLGESLCIVTFFLFSDSGLHLFNSSDFYFEWADTENQQYLYRGNKVAARRYEIYLRVLDNIFQHKRSFVSSGDHVIFFLLFSQYITTLLAIFRRFPTTFGIFPKIFTNFCRRLPKIAEEDRRRSEHVSIIH